MIRRNQSEAVNRRTDNLMIKRNQSEAVNTLHNKVTTILFVLDMKVVPAIGFIDVKTTGG
jgi:hypothetical protein